MWIIFLEAILYTFVHNFLKPCSAAVGCSSVVAGAPALVGIPAIAGVPAVVVRLPMFQEVHVVRKIPAVNSFPTISGALLLLIPRALKGQQREMFFALSLYPRYRIRMLIFFRFCRTLTSFIVFGKCAKICQLFMRTL